MCDVGWSHNSEDDSAGDDDCCDDEQPSDHPNIHVASDTRLDGVDPEAGDSNHPRLGDLHRPVVEEEGAVLFEGGSPNLKYNTKAAKSPFYPFPTLALLLMMQFVTKHQVSRVVLDAVFYMIRFKDPETGAGFDVKDLDGVQAEHFAARMRDYMNLYEVYRRDVRCSTTAIATRGAGSTSVVYDVPINKILERQLLSSSSMTKFSKNPGGKQLATSEAMDSNLASDHHVFCGPERP